MCVCVCVIRLEMLIVLVVFRSFIYMRSKLMHKSHIRTIILSLQVLA